MKKITSLTLGISFLIMTYTGIMLFLCPHGRVAYWSDWHLWGLSKKQYGDIHTTSMLVFVTFGLLHIYYNWKPIVSYLRNQKRRISFTKKELLIASGINVLFIAGTLMVLQPFKGFLDFEEQIKDSWTQSYGEPPYGHAEETKLNMFCKKMGIDPGKAKEILTAHKIIFTMNDSLLEIAKHNGLSPSTLYQLIKSLEKQTVNIDDTPVGLGRKTLQALSEMKKIDLEKSIHFVRSQGIKDVTGESKILNIAEEMELSPVELYEKLHAF